MKRKVRIKASELTDVDVDLISLVHRPSSRIPFGIMKSADAKGGTTMKSFDLGQLFKSEAPAPVVTSVIVKGETSEQMLKLLTDEGFTVEKAETTDGVTVYMQETAYSGDVAVVKLSDNVAITVPVVKADGSFAEMCAARGFYPSIGIATELLQCELYRAVEKSDSPAAAADKVRATVSDFGNFMGQLVSGLPVTVFKTEQAISTLAGDVSVETETVEKAAGTKKKTKAAAAEDAADGGVDDDEENADGTKKKVKKGDDTEGATAVEATAEAAPADAAATEETTANPNANVETGAGVVEGQPTITHLAKEDVAEIIKTALAEALTPVNEGLGGLTERLNTVEGVVQKNDEAIRGTTYGGVFDTGVNKQPVEKSSEDRTGLLDTGYSHRK